MSQRVAMLRGERVYRIHWQLGTDLLLGVCFCGAERAFDGPEELWEWLLGHPRDHRPAGSEPADPRPIAHVPIAVDA